MGWNGEIVGADVRVTRVEAFYGIACLSYPFAPTVCNAVLDPSRSILLFVFISRSSFSGFDPSNFHNFGIVFLALWYKDLSVTKDIIGNFHNFFKN